MPKRTEQLAILGGKPAIPAGRIKKWLPVAMCGRGGHLLRPEGLSSGAETCRHAHGYDGAPEGA